MLSSDSAPVFKNRTTRYGCSALVAKNDWKWQELASGRTKKKSSICTAEPISDKSVSRKQTNDQSAGFRAVYSNC